MSPFILLTVKPEYGDLADYNWAAPVFLVVLAYFGIRAIGKSL